MKLTALLGAIRESKGPVTGIELALRLGVSPGEVAAMLDALRASGQLGTDVPTHEPIESCESAGLCSLSCPGPEDCSLVIDLSVTNLEIKAAAPR